MEGSPPPILIWPKAGQKTNGGYCYPIILGRQGNVLWSQAGDSCMITGPAREPVPVLFEDESSPEGTLYARVPDGDKHVLVTGKKIPYDVSYDNFQLLLQLEKNLKYEIIKVVDLDNFKVVPPTRWENLVHFCKEVGLTKSLASDLINDPRYRGTVMDFYRTGIRSSRLYEIAEDLIFEDDNGYVDSDDEFDSEDEDDPPPKGKPKGKLFRQQPEDPSMFDEDIEETSITIEVVGSFEDLEKPPERLLKVVGAPTTVSVFKETLTTSGKVSGGKLLGHAKKIIKGLPFDVTGPDKALLYPGHSPRSFGMPKGFPRIGPDILDRATQNVKHSVNTGVGPTVVGIDEIDSG